jgi:sugar fermentation stimulation protein A
MRFEQPLVPGRFLCRLNRFAALVKVAGQEEYVHVRNSGRLKELFAPGQAVLLERAKTPGRRTRFTLALVRLPSGDVSADAHLPNVLVEAALQKGRLDGFRGYRILRREPIVGRHRLDFLLERGTRKCLLEVKSVTLVEAGVALFPDAPTQRGTRHLKHLTAARRKGLEAGVLFVIQRPDAVAFAPNRSADPQFEAALRISAAEGVGVMALCCRVSPRGVWLDRRIPVHLDKGRPGDKVDERY